MRFLLALVAAAPLFAQQQCTLTLSQSVFNLAASTVSPNTGVVTVMGPDGCSWNASVSSGAASWLSIYMGQTGTLPATNKVGFQAAQNLTTQARSGTITIGNATLTVNQAAAVCTYAVTPTTMSFPVSGGSGTVQVITNCVWSTGVTVNWITLQDNAFGTLNGSFTYTVGASPCISTRTGGIGVGYPGTQTNTGVVISQDGAPNNLTLTPTTATIGADGASGTVAINIATSCPWTAFSDASWLQITSVPSGFGSASLMYRAAANPATAPRTGHITVGTQTFTLTQQGIAAPSIQLTAVINAASGVQGPVSPGEIVSLFGTNLGPAAGVSLTDIATAKTLGGVTVLFDGTPAAMTYASATQINAVTPYGLGVGGNTQIQVQYQGVTSNAVSLLVQNASPGIFTLDGSGTGAGAILNQDYSVNARANPAAQGSIVAVYLTGGGLTNPASVDATLTSPTAPLPQLTQPVSVLIGQSVAQVQYAGAAPGGIAGFTQINVVVPTGLVPGASVPIVIGIGAYVSQPGVTLAIK